MEKSSFKWLKVKFILEGREGLVVSSLYLSICNSYAFAHSIVDMRVNEEELILNPRFFPSKKISRGKIASTGVKL